MNGLGFLILFGTIIVLALDVDSDSEREATEHDM